MLAGLRIMGASFLLPVMLSSCWPKIQTSALVGTWRERTAIACDGTQIASNSPIEELIFRADGSFSVTWFPFETYVDYWGSYTYDSQTGRLDMTIENGNYIPDGTDLSGSVVVQSDGTLRLDAVYFGRPSPDAGGSAQGPICGYVIAAPGTGG